MKKIGRVTRKLKRLFSKTAGMGTVTFDDGAVDKRFGV